MLSIIVKSPEEFIELSFLIKRRLLKDLIIASGQAKNKPIFKPLNTIILKFMALKFQTRLISGLKA